MMCESSQRSPYGFKMMGTHMITNVSSESGNGVANYCGLVAQTVEHSTVNRIVEGSIPSQTSIASIFFAPFAKSGQRLKTCPSGQAEDLKIRNLVR